MCLADYAGYALLHDACFLAGYFRQCIPQILRMIHADIGNDGEERRKHIGAVESSSKTYFDHGNVHFLRCKIRECHSGEGLEERRLQFVEKRAVLFYKPRHFFFCDRSAVDTDAFCERDQMGAGVEAYFISGGLEGSGNQMRS